MNESPQHNTDQKNGDALTGSSTANPGGIPLLRMQLAALGAYFNCSDCRQISLRFNSTPEPSNTLIAVTEAHLASHFDTLSTLAGTDDE